MGYYSQHAVEDLQTLGRSDPELTTLSLLTKDVEATLDKARSAASWVLSASRDVPPPTSH